jgi:capsular exopolysaccharide synthesis family protein
MSDKPPLAPDDAALPPVPEPHHWHITDAFWVLYRRRWALVLTFLLVAAAAVLKVLSATPVYESRAQLVVADQSSVITLQGVVQEPDPAGSLERQARLMQSRSFARRVIEELGMWPPDAAASSSGARAFVARQWKRAKAALARTPEPASPAGDPGETLAESRAIDGLLSNLQVVPVSNARIIEVSYRSADPALAARVVNTLTATLIKTNREAKSSAAEEASSWLSTQLEDQRQKVQASELALQKYRERKDALSLEAGQNTVVQRLNALDEQATRAKTDRIDAEALYRRLAASQTDPDALDAFPAISTNADIQRIRARLVTLRNSRAQLATTLGEKHPQMVQMDADIRAAENELSTEVARAVEAVRQQYLSAAARENALAAALDTQRTSALALNRQAIEYGVLAREVDSNQQIYQDLLQRSKEMALAGQLRNSTVQVLDAAEVPRTPVSPGTVSSLLVGLLLAGVISVGMVVALETFDTRLQTPEQLRTALRVPFLGILPRVSRRALRGGFPLLSDVPTVYAEACRSLRTNLLATGDGQGHRTLLVTSAAPGDGKSIVAVNLALALGRSGRRVLIIDADLRSPVQHDLLKRRQRPGLADVLKGTSKPSQAVVTTPFSGVWLLPSGACPLNPSELVGSSRFRELLTHLREYFDWVIIDSPPVMAVTDPAVIAGLASGVLFVVNAQRTRRRIAQAALDRLETAGATFAGAVLNSVKLDRDRYYNERYYLPFYGDYLGESRTA